MKAKMIEGDEIELKQDSIDSLKVHLQGPVLVPGEEITPEIVEYLTAVRRTGVEIHGCEDRSISTLKVVDEREFLHDFGSGWG